MFFCALSSLSLCLSFPLSFSLSPFLPLSLASTNIGERNIQRHTHMGSQLYTQLNFWLKDELPSSQPLHSGLPDMRVSEDSWICSNKVPWLPMLYSPQDVRAMDYSHAQILSLAKS